MNQQKMESEIIAFKETQCGLGDMGTEASCELG